MDSLRYKKRKSDPFCVNQMREKAEDKKKRQGKKLPETSQSCVDLSESETESNEFPSNNQE